MKPRTACVTDGVWTGKIWSELMVSLIGRRKLPYKSILNAPRMMKSNRVGAGDLGYDCTD